MLITNLNHTLSLPRTATKVIKEMKTRPVDQCQDRNTIILSEPFYCEIVQHRLPIEREAITALACSPGALGYYVWIAWKCWGLREE